MENNEGICIQFVRDGVVRAESTMQYTEEIHRLVLEITKTVETSESAVQHLVENQTKIAGIYLGIPYLSVIPVAFLKIVEAPDETSSNSVYDNLRTAVHTEIDRMYDEGMSESAVIESVLSALGQLLNDQENGLV